MATAAGAAGSSAAVASAAAAPPAAALAPLPPACPICLETLLDSDAVVLSACASEVPQHACCASCFAAYVDTVLREQRIPTCFACMAAGCKQPAAVAAGDVRRAMGGEAEARYTAVSLLHWQRQDRQFACPACAHVASLDVQKEDAVVACPACGATACPTCRRRAHRGSCREAVVAANWPLIESLRAVGARAILCPGCFMVLQKEGEACNHMTCQCGTHVCWVCAAELPPGDPYLHFDECPQAGPLPANERLLRRWRQADIVPQSHEEAAAAALAAADLARQRPPPRRAAVAATARLAGRKRKAPASEPTPLEGRGSRARSESIEAEQQRQASAPPQQQQRRQQQASAPPQQQQHGAEVHRLQQQVLLLERRLQEREQECAELRTQLQAALDDKQQQQQQLQLHQEASVLLQRQQRQASPAPKQQQQRRQRRRQQQQRRQEEVEEEEQEQEQEDLTVVVQQFQRLAPAKQLQYLLMHAQAATEAATQHQLLRHAEAIIEQWRGSLPRPHRRRISRRLPPASPLSPAEQAQRAAESQAAAQNQAIALQQFQELAPAKQVEYLLMHAQAAAEAATQHQLLLYAKARIAQMRVQQQA